MELSVSNHPYDRTRNVLLAMAKEGVSVPVSNSQRFDNSRQLVVLDGESAEVYRWFSETFSGVNSQFLELVKRGAVSWFENRDYNSIGIAPDSDSGKLYATMQAAAAVDSGQFIYLHRILHRSFSWHGLTPANNDYLRRALDSVQEEEQVEGVRAEGELVSLLAETALMRSGFGSNLRWGEEEKPYFPARTLHDLTVEQSNALKLDRRTCFPFRPKYHLQIATPEQMVQMMRAGAIRPAFRLMGRTLAPSGEDSSRE